MDLLAITAQLSVLNGTVQEGGAVPGLLAQPAPVKSARGREHDFLFAHLTLTGSFEETELLAQDLVDGLAQDYYQSSGSVTASLRRAVIATNDRLLRHNLRPDASKRSAVFEGALTCAALHNDELFTLQVGEGLAFLGHNFGVERLPVQLPQHLTPLGRSAGIDIRFAYHRLQNGDMLLLADPRLAYLTGTMLSPVLVDTEIESGLESLMSLVAGDTARLLLVEFADELPSSLPLTFVHSKQPAPSKKAPATAARTTEPVGKPERTKGVPAAPILMSAQKSETTLPSDADSRPALDPQLVNTSTPPAAFTVETGARRVASTSARGLSRASGWLASFLGLLTLPASDSETNETPVNWAIPTMIALLVPIILAAIVAGVYFQRSTAEQIGDIKQQMIDAIAFADEVTGDPVETRIRYNAVLALADEAELIRPDDPEVARMRSQALDALDRLDGITRLSAAPFYRYQEGTTLSRILLAEDSGGIVVLNETAQQVLIHPTDDNYLNQTADEPSILVFTGQAVGSQVIGPLIDILWLPAGAGASRDNIASLDRAGGLFNYFPNLGDVRGLTLDNSSAWISPEVMATFSNRLYVLDPGAQQIWKYYPLDTGFTQQQDDSTIAFSAEMGLDQAVDFDIYSEDGSIIVVYRDGRVRYYDSRSGRVQWDENTLAQSGLGTPFAGPAAVDIIGRGLTASIFILDPATERLVQLSRGGTVLAQYRVLDAAGKDILGNATDFAVVESPRSIFVTAGNSIYRASQP